MVSRLPPACSAPSVTVNQVFMIASARSPVGEPNELFGLDLRVERTDLQPVRSFSVRGCERMWLASSRADAWCARCGDRSQRPSSSHDQRVDDHEPRVEGVNPAAGQRSS